MGIYLQNIKGTTGLRSKEIELKKLKSATSPLASKIIKALLKKEMYPQELANKLKENEQKIYYHIRNLEKSGIIEETRRKDIRGGSAKYYGVSSPAFTVLMKKPEIIAGNRSEERKQFLEPFIIDGELNSLVIVGSPDPHGPEMARSRDGHFTVDLALFLGSFLNHVPEARTKLDTEFQKDDWKNNIIIIGGPIVNNLARTIHHKLPIYFETSKIVCSKITNKCYEEGSIGIIIKTDNPMCKGKKILMLAGNSYRGTKAAIIALTKEFDEIIKGNKYNKKINARIVSGLDNDGDGIVDYFKLIE